MAEQSDFQSLIQMLAERMDRQDARLDRQDERAERQDARLDRQEKQQDVTNDLLLRLLSQQEAMFNLHQNFQRKQEGFNERQERFNERQDQFNIIFLDEVRDIKLDVRELRKDITTIRDVTLKQYDERLKRLEDFMDGFMRKAG